MSIRAGPKDGAVKTSVWIEGNPMVLDVKSGVNLLGGIPSWDCDEITGGSIITDDQNGLVWVGGDLKAHAIPTSFHTLHQAPSNLPFKKTADKFKWS